MADEPTRSGADGGPPVGDPATGRIGSDDGNPVAPLTVAELLARSGTDVRRRRAERRESAEATGRHQPVRDDGPDDRPPLRGGVRREPFPAAGAPSSPLLPTGWQPALPGPATTPPAAPPSTAPPSTAPPSTAPPSLPPSSRPSSGPSSPWPAASWSPAPAVVPPAAVLRSPSPAVVPPRPVVRPASAAGPAPAVDHAPAPARSPAAGPGPTPGARPVPAGPVSGSTYTAAPRVVPPVSVTPAVAPPAPAPTPSPSPSPSRPVPALPGAQPSVPVPGVRRSLPLPPIPGRDVPASGQGTITDITVPRAPASPARRRLTRVALALVALLGVVAAYYVGLYFYVDRTLDRVDALVTDGPEVLAPQLQESGQTYLLVGTHLPGRSGLSAVSTLIAHVSGDGDQAVLVSVPPTALSDTPTCRDDDGEVRPAVTEAFASALLDGGPSCLVRSVQQLTGLRVDHYLGLDLERLPGMVDALGDVSVCVPDAATGAGSAMDLPPGDTRLTGEDVADFLRAGSTGSDLTGAAAAEREQLVLTATLRTALDTGTVADPLTLTRLLTSTGNTFTVDADTALDDVRALGSTLGGLSGDALQRAEVPVARVGYVPAGSDQAAVVVDATATRELFDAVIDGGTLPATAEQQAAADGAATTDPSTGSGAADSLPDPALTQGVPAGTLVTVAPAGVTVDVLDASGAGRTADVADQLAAGGFRIGARGEEPAAVDRTVVRYGPASLEPARTVVAAVPGAVLQETDEVDTAVQLVIGPDFTAIGPVAVGTPVPTTAAPAPVDEGTGAASACS